MWIDRVQALLIGEDQRRVVRVAAVARIARALHGPTTRRCRPRSRGRFGSDRIRAAAVDRHRQRLALVGAEVERRRRRCTWYDPARAVGAVELRPLDRQSPTTLVEHLRRRPASANGTAGCRAVVRCTSVASASRPRRCARPAAPDASAKLHALPGRSKPEHSDLQRAGGLRRAEAGLAPEHDHRLRIARRPRSAPGSRSRSRRRRGSAAAGASRRRRTAPRSSRGRRCRPRRPPRTAAACGRS